MKHFWASVRNLVIRGFLFMLPIILVVVLAGKIWMSLHGVVSKVTGRLGIDRFAGLLLAVSITTLIFLLICLLAGMITNIAAIGKVKAWIERHVLRFVPGYVYLKTMFEEQFSSSGGNNTSAMVWLYGAWQPCMLVEEGGKGWSVVYVPAAPHLSAGSIYVVEQYKVKKIHLPLGKLKDHIGRFGEGLLEYAETSPALAPKNEAGS